MYTGSTITLGNMMVNNVVVMVILVIIFWMQCNTNNTGKVGGKMRLEKKNLVKVPLLKKFRSVTS